MCDRMRPESQVRSGLAAGGKWIRTIGTPKISYRFGHSEILRSARPGPSAPLMPGQAVSVAA